MTISCTPHIRAQGIEKTTVAGARGVRLATDTDRTIRVKTKCSKQCAPPFPHEGSVLFYCCPRHSWRPQPRLWRAPSWMRLRAWGPQPSLGTLGGDLGEIYSGGNLRIRSFAMRLRIAQRRCLPIRRWLSCARRQRVHPLIDRNRAGLFKHLNGARASKAGRHIEGDATSLVATVHVCSMSEQ